MKKYLGVLILFLVLAACGNDDEGGLGGIAVAPRLLSEVTLENDDEIREFLQTHFFQLDAETGRVIIDTIAGVNANETPMLQQTRDTTINVSSIQFNIDDGETDIAHKLYYLEVREGAGITPTVADSTLLKFEGSLLDGSNFDAASDFFWQELPFFIRGFANGAAKIKSGTTDGVVVNADGTTSINDSGIALIFMPSGLAYFNNPPTTAIALYDPLIFSIEVGLFIENTDNDNDGIPSIMEDLNNNGDIFDDNTDNTVERERGLVLGVPNFQDIDDDGDGVLTRTEISDANGNIQFPYPDSNNDGTPDYLDPDVQRDPNN